MKKKVPLFRVGLLLLLLFAILALAVQGWHKLYSSFLELTPPTVFIVDQDEFRGVGILARTLKLRLSDSHSGLHEVHVQIRQQGLTKTIKRVRLAGVREKTIVIPFDGEKSQLEEGEATLIVTVSDQSLWGNEKIIDPTFLVDYRRPNVKILTSPARIREGGSQIVFYRVIDENPALSGVKVGEKTYVGFPARGMDKAFDDDTLRVALYTVDLGSASSKLSIRIFADDKVGNSISVPFPNEIQKRTSHEQVIRISDKFLRLRVPKVYQDNLKVLKKIATDSGQVLSFRTPKGSTERLLEKFRLLNETLREKNQLELIAAVTEPRFERYWSDEFLQPSGSNTTIFGNTIVFKYGETQVGARLCRGLDISPRDGSEDVTAANDGIVIFGKEVGVYGQMVGVDHGLGLVSLYGFLSSIAVTPGQEVSKGDVIGTVGTSGLSPKRQLYFDLRLHEIPVDPYEWFSASWYNTEINGRVRQLKRKLGVPVP